MRSDDFNVSPLPLEDERIRRRIATLIDRHSEVLTARAIAQEVGTKLKNGKHVLGELDAQYMENLEVAIEKDPMRQLAKLKQDLQQLKLAGAETLVLEAEYDEKAEFLVQSEAGLRNLELKIYKSLVKSPASSIRPSIDGMSERRRVQQEFSESDVANGRTKLNILLRFGLIFHNEAMSICLVRV